jgi:hypothetical protein
MQPAPVKALGERDIRGRAVLRREDPRPARRVRRRCPGFWQGAGFLGSRANSPTVALHIRARCVKLLRGHEQSGACFYCGAPVTPLLGLEHSADVDHYFPTSSRSMNTPRAIRLCEFRRIHSVPIRVPTGDTKPRRPYTTDTRSDNRPLSWPLPSPSPTGCKTHPCCEFQSALQTEANSNRRRRSARLMRRTPACRDRCMTDRGKVRAALGQLELQRKSATP